MNINDEIKPFKVKIDKYRPYLYAGASLDFNPIHLDDEFAKKVGLPGKILHGLCTMAYTYRSVTENLDPGKIKKFKARFSNVVLPGDEITVKSKISNQENRITTIDLISENQNGHPVITNAQIVIED